MALFAVQAGLLHQALGDRRGIGRSLSWRLLAAVVISAIYGAVTEIYQGSLVSRSADLWDAVADLLGALLYAGGWIFLGARWRRSGPFG
jgi:VanZ family protein